MIRPRHLDLMLGVLAGAEPVKALPEWNSAERNVYHADIGC